MIRSIPKRILQPRKSNLELDAILKESQLALQQMNIFLWVHLGSRFAQVAAALSAEMMRKKKEETLEAIQKASEQERRCQMWVMACKMAITCGKNGKKWDK